MRQRVPKFWVVYGTGGNRGLNDRALVERFDHYQEAEHFILNFPGEKYPFLTELYIEFQIEKVWVFKEIL